MANEGRSLTLKLLWMMFNRRTFLMEFADTLQPEIFGSNEAQYLARISLDYWNKNKKTHPEIGVFDTLEAHEQTERLEQEKVTYEVVERMYDELLEVDKADNDYIMAAASDFIKRQTLALALKEAINTLDGGEPAEALKIVDKARMVVEPRPTRTLSVIADQRRLMHRLGERELDENHFSTGLMKLDKAIGGGLRSGELAALIAPTGRGKTMWLCSVAAKAFFFGAEVVYYTLEVDQDEIAKRTLASLSSVSMNDITMWATFKASPEMGKADRNELKNPQELIEEAFHNVRRVGGKKRDIHVVDLARATVTTLAADIERRKREGQDPKLIIIDYADRLTPEGRFEKKVDGEQKIYSDLMALAKEYDVAIWTALQGNRQSLGKVKLDLQHIAGAYAKAWEATYVIAAGQSDTMRRENRFTFGMAKVRRTVSTATGDQFKVYYDFAKCQFLDWESEDFGDGETAAPLTHYGSWDEEDEEEDGKHKRGKGKY